MRAVVAVVRSMTSCNIIIQVSYNSMSGTLNDRRRFPYFSRTIPSGDLVAVGVASILCYYDWRRAVVITEEMVEFTTVRY